MRGRLVDIVAVRQHIRVLGMKNTSNMAAQSGDFYSELPSIFLNCWGCWRLSWLLLDEGGIHPPAHGAGAITPGMLAILTVDSIVCRQS